MFYNTSSYEFWASLAARILLAIPLAIGAWFKMSMFSMQVGAAASVGVPLPQVAVAAALVLEVALVLSLLTGVYSRLAGLLGAAYIALLAVLFYRDFSDPMQFASFMSHLPFAAALLLVSVLSKPKD